MSLKPFLTQMCLGFETGQYHLKAQYFFYVLCISILLLDMIMEDLRIQTVCENIMYIIYYKGSVHLKLYEQRQARNILDLTSLVDL